MFCDSLQTNLLYWIRWNINPQIQSFRLIIQHMAEPWRPGGATTGGLCGGIDVDRWASLCQSVSILSALALHLITHSLIHSLIQLLKYCSSTGRQSHLPFKITTLPPFGQLNPSPGQDDVLLEKWLHRTISDIHAVSLIYKSSLGEKKECFLPGNSVKGLEVGVLLVALPWLYLWLNHCHSQLVTERELGIHSEIVLVGKMGLDWSPGGRVIIRYDHWETTWACVTAFVILTPEKKRRGEKGWLKDCLPSLCLWTKKYGDTRVVSKDVPWQQSGRKSCKRDGHERKEHPEGVSARCLRPLLYHFVAWRHLEKMQMSRKQRDCMIV